MIFFIKLIENWICDGITFALCWKAFSKGTPLSPQFSLSSFFNDQSFSPLQDHLTTRSSASRRLVSKGKERRSEEDRGDAAEAGAKRRWRCTCREEGRSGVTVLALHGGWILIEAQRIKLLKIRLSLLVLFLVLLHLASLPLLDLRFPLGHDCEPFFIPEFFISRIFIDSCKSNVPGIVGAAPVPFPIGSDRSS